MYTVINPWAWCNHGRFTLHVRTAGMVLKRSTVGNGTEPLSIIITELSAKISKAVQQPYTDVPLCTSVMNFELNSQEPIQFGKTEIMCLTCGRAELWSLSLLRSFRGFKTCRSSFQCRVRFYRVTATSPNVLADEHGEQSEHREINIFSEVVFRQHFWVPVKLIVRNGKELFPMSNICYRIPK